MSMAKVGAIDLYYEEQGSGYPLLLIMGLAADSQAWLFQVPELAKHYRTISFDNRGVGRSSKPGGPYAIDAMADEAAGLLDVLEIERAHVVGVSMGGMIAQELVLRHPSRVRGLVLACTFPEPDAYIHRTREQSLTELGGSVGPEGQVQIDVSKIDPMMVFQNLMPRVFTPAFLMSDLPKLMQLFGGALQWGFSMDAILAQVGATMGHRTTDRLHQITAPTLVITGDADLLIPPGNSDILAREIPNARLVKVPGGSHGFNFETPELFNREVLTFLSAVDAG
jgi:3-oxoadipate enol-lactonase